MNAGFDIWQRFRPERLLDRKWRALLTVACGASWFGAGTARILADVLRVGLTAGVLLACVARFLRDHAAREERRRLSRDLHDGLLQSLTAWRLQLHMFEDTVAETDPALRERLRDIRGQMCDEQRELRALLQRHHQHARTAEGLDFSVAERLNELRHRFALEWGLDVKLQLSGPHSLVPPLLRSEICRLVHEALVNVARHAHTSLARVELTASDERVVISVSDRGCGFPFRGRYDLSSLRRRRLGPSTITERVADLRGDLVLHSSDAGARLEIMLPLRSGAGKHGASFSVPDDSAPRIGGVVHRPPARGRAAVAGV